MQIQFLSSTRKLVVAVAAGMALVGAGVLVAHAAGETGVPRLVHYEGYLEKGGIPYDSAPPNTSLNAVFRLDNGSDSTPGALAYDYNVPAMAVSAGRFVVDIPIPAQHDWVFDQADHVYLTVSLDGTALNGRQRITPVPYAVRAAEAVQFRVKSDLQVEGGATIRNGWNPGIELRSTGGGTPYLDFSNDASSDYDARFILLNDNHLALHGADMSFEGVVNLVNGAPAIAFSDIDQGYNYWIHVNDGRFYVLYDENGDGIWDSPFPLYFAGRNAVFGANVNAPSLTISGSSGSNVPHNCEWVSAFAGVSNYTVVAICPTGKKVISGGCSSAPDLHPISVTSSLRGGYDDRWECNFSGTPLPYRHHRADAFCCEF